MKIFVTGATGVVGRRLVPLLTRAGHEVSAVTRSQGGKDRLARAGATPVALDLFDATAVRQSVAGHDAVVNLATHIPRSTIQMFMPRAWRENDRIRREASSTLVDACLATGVQRFVQESFAPVYPDMGDQWIDERVPIKPVRYNLSVTDAEASADRFAQSGRAGVVLRFAGFYGPDAHQTIALFDLLRKGLAPIPGPPDAYISSISHNDAATAAATSLTLPSGPYNVVDDEPVTHRQFVDAMASVLGVSPPALPPRWLTPMFGSLGEMASRSQRMSNRKLKAATDWAPAYVSVREGFAATAIQLRSNEAVPAASQR